MNRNFWKESWAAAESNLGPPLNQPSAPFEPEMNSDRCFMGLLGGGGGGQHSFHDQNTDIISIYFISKRNRSREKEEEETGRQTDSSWILASCQPNNRVTSGRTHWQTSTDRQSKYRHVHRLSWWASCEHWTTVLRPTGVLTEWTPHKRHTCKHWQSDRFAVRCVMDDWFLSLITWKKKDVSIQQPSLELHSSLHLSKQPLHTAWPKEDSQPNHQWHLAESFNHSQPQMNRTLNWHSTTGSHSSRQTAGTWNRLDINVVFSDSTVDISIIYIEGGCQADVASLMGN